MRITGRTLLFAASALVASAFAGAALADANKPTIGVVVKIGGIPWFNAMENGIKKAAGETRPAKAKAARQTAAKAKAVKKETAKATKKAAKKTTAKKPAAKAVKKSPKKKGGK